MQAEGFSFAEAAAAAGHWPAGFGEKICCHAQQKLRGEATRLMAQFILRRHFALTRSNQKREIDSKYIA